jgi:hypothetical protein
MFNIKSVFCFLLIFALFDSTLNAGQCPAGKLILWYHAESTIDGKTHNGFSRQLFNELSAPLTELGYCLTMFDKNDTMPFSFLYRDNLLMRVACIDIRESHAPIDAKNQPALVVDLISVENFKKGNFEAFPQRPLVSLSFSSEDIGSIRIIFAKKIIENLRTQYICNLMISSDPPGVKVTARSGLSDVTPFEWVVPVGKLDIQCNLKDYITYKKEFNMDRPGVYNYFLQMKKRQFYHSKFFIPGIGCGLVSAVCYGLDNYYYYKYKSYREPEKIGDPGIFERTFNTAQTFERLSLSFLAASCVFFGLSIWF